MYKVKILIYGRYVFVSSHEQSESQLKRSIFNS